MDYLKYYLPGMVQLAVCASFIAGGNYVWAGVATLPLLAIIDSLLPLDLAKRHMPNRFLANIPIWFSTLLGFGLYLVMAWHVGHHELTIAQMVGTVLSAGWITVLIVVPSSHELWHQRGTFARLFGRYAQVCFLDCTRDIAHLVGHHITVDTVKDGDTAARGKTIYNFSPHAVWQATIESQRIESDALVKRGYGRWSIRHRLWKAILAQIIFQSLLYSLGGLLAVALALSAMVLARFWLETFNYFQHYGQVRVVGSPIEKRHVWNHLAPLSRIMAFEITNHAGHHLNSYVPYYDLEPHREAIRMPNVFVCFFAAMIPPLWFKAIIGPALKQWDLEYASPAERALAREQNLRVGWPDWFGAAEPQTFTKQG